MSYIEPRLRKRGNKWQIDYVSPDGRRRRLSAGRDFRMAERMRIKYANWLLDGKDPEREIEREQVARKKQFITLRELFPIFMERYGSKRSKSTQTSYRTSFKNICRCPELAETPIENINRGLMIDYMNARIKQDGVSARTVDLEKAFVSVMLSCAVDWDDLDRNPLRSMKRFSKGEKRNVTLSPEQAEALIAELDGPIADIVEFALYSGMRKGNILTVLIEQIVFNDRNNTAMINAVIKGGKKEVLPIALDAVDVLRRVIGDRTEGYVFINPETDRPYVQVHRAIDRAIRHLGLTAEDGSKLRFHDFRHVRANWWLDGGARLEDVQAAYGHTNKATTERYITVDKQAVGERLSLIKSPGKKLYRG